MTAPSSEVSASVGRPRRFSDEDFFNAFARVISQLGYQGLTLEAVALEAGCSRPALNRRFGDKQGLIQSFIGWIVAQVDVKFEKFEHSLNSPLAALKAGSFAFTTGSMNPNQSDSRFDPSNQLRFFSNAWSDPMLRPLMAEMAQTVELSAVRYLEAAIATGELIPCDTEELAYLLSVSAIGALIHDFDSTHEELAKVHERVFDAILRPYIVQRPRPE